MWHFSFQNVSDLPEALVQGEEHMYIKHFIHRLAQNPNTISNYDLDIYQEADSVAGAMRAAFSAFIMFEQDAVDNKRMRQGKAEARCRVYALGW